MLSRMPIAGQVIRTQLKHAVKVHAADAATASIDVANSLTHAILLGQGAHRMSEKAVESTRGGPTVSRQPDSTILDWI